MDNDLQSKIHELFGQATPEVQKFLLSDEIDKSTAILGKLYSLPISKYIALKNVVTFILLGSIEPSDVVTSLQKSLEIDEDRAYKLATDLDKSILQKVRRVILGEEVGDVKVLKVSDKDKEANKDELRKVILDTTKRDSAIETTPVKPGDKRPKKILAQGSRSQLLEQLNILDSIPDDSEINARLSHIKSQIHDIEGKEVEVVVPISKELENALSGGGKTVVTPTIHTATYSRAPTEYNIDPYREVAD
jgi:hypothetical protein